MDGNSLIQLKRYGQNFLNDMNIIRKIADVSRAGSDAPTVEVGAGMGILTRELAARSKSVLSIEIDRRLEPVLTKNLRDCTNVTVHYGDALKFDFAALPAPARFCANIPYNITAPLLVKVSESGVFECITVMVQKEVARRLTARPGTPEYGAFTVFFRNLADAELCFEVPPGAFTPPPKVTSGVVFAKTHAPFCNRPEFTRVVRAAFGQRRKQLINALGALGLPKERLLAGLEKAGISPSARGETLGLEEFARLTAGVYPETLATASSSVSP